MKTLNLGLAAIIASAAIAGDETVLTVRTKLGSVESYQLYEHLNVPEVATPDGRTLVKMSEDIVCKKFSAYPGDREYECEVSFRVDQSGTIVK